MAATTSTQKTTTKSETQKVSFIDASGLTVGRLASTVAKRLLKGEEIHIVNAEKAMVSGRRDHIIEHYQWKKNVGFRRKGPFYPRTPDRMLKRSVRGMLDYNDKPSHRSAYRRLRTYIGVPAEFKGKTTETVADAKFSAARGMSLGEISGYLGFTVVSK